MEKKKKERIVEVILGAVFFIGVGIFLYFWLPGQIPHTVIFHDIETNQPIANAEIKVFHDPFCVSSPCHPPKNIFSGSTDENGKITLSGHSTDDLNKSYHQIGFVYYFEIEGYSRPKSNENFEVGEGKIVNLSKE